MSGHKSIVVEVFPDDVGMDMKDIHCKIRGEISFGGGDLGKGMSSARTYGTLS